MIPRSTGTAALAGFDPALLGVLCLAHRPKRRGPGRSAAAAAAEGALRSGGSGFGRERMGPGDLGMGNESFCKLII